MQRRRLKPCPNSVFTFNGIAGQATPICRRRTNSSGLRGGGRCSFYSRAGRAFMPPLHVRISPWRARLRRIACAGRTTVAPSHARGGQERLAGLWSWRCWARAGSLPPAGAHLTGGRRASTAASSTHGWLGGLRVGLAASWALSPRNGRVLRGDDWGLSRAAKRQAVRLGWIVSWAAICAAFHMYI
jgi:hypothetical protein